MTVSDAEAIAAFNREFVVYRDYSAQVDDLSPPASDSSSERNLLQFLTPDLMKLLLPFSDWSIESRQEYLVMSQGRGFRPSVECKQLIDDALSIRSLLSIEIDEALRDKLR